MNYVLHSPIKFLLISRWGALSCWWWDVKWLGWASVRCYLGIMAYWLFVAVSEKSLSTFVQGDFGGKVHLWFGYFGVFIFGFEGVACDGVSEFIGLVVFLLSMGVSELIFVGWTSGRSAIPPFWELQVRVDAKSLLGWYHLILRFFLWFIFIEISWSRLLLITFVAFVCY